ncbi:gas vesicle protein [Candidatus Nitrosotenuis cloacae]|uniref:gas vesicle protein n=1 Tax=Candidatus Nitrosotenuis cloacae TaxID=1603555 RepID=UPI00228028B5|nr:gas vesicle protein [Candidatus Nitrosotenuis cloacae]
MSLKQLTKKELTVIDLLDRILDKGVVINGDITISVVGVDLLSLKINLVIASLETAKRYGLKLPWEKWEKERETQQLKELRRK